MKTDLQLAKTTTQKYHAKGDSKQFLQYCLLLQRYIPLFQGNLVRQQVFVIQIFLFRVTFTVAAKMFRTTLDFINAHLQQRDQVASVLRTVDFWLIVCGNTCVLTVATKWATSKRFFLYTFTTSYSVGFVVLWWILCEKFYFINHA